MTAPSFPLGKVRDKKRKGYCRQQRAAEVFLWANLLFSCSYGRVKEPDWAQRGWRQHKP